MLFEGILLALLRMTNTVVIKKKGVLEVLGALTP